MKSKEIAAYVPLMEHMSEKAICFLREQGIVFPAAYPMPELQWSLEKRTKLYGHYNKRNIISELKRLCDSFEDASVCFWTEKQHGEVICFLEKLGAFLSGYTAEESGIQVWRQLNREFYLLNEQVVYTEQQCTGNGGNTKLWRRLVGLFDKVQQIEIKQQLSGVFSSEGRIVLYMNNIETMCKDKGWNMNEYLQSVLVHEYTHACHYGAFMEHQLKCNSVNFSLEKSMLRWSGAYFSVNKTSCVKETLARYMQVVWCRYYSPDLSERLFVDDYGEYVIVPNWPYAGAQMLLSLPRREAEPLFYRIWQKSLNDWKRAYELLTSDFSNVK